MQPNRATKSSNTGLKQESERFVCKEKLSSRRQERRGVMWWRFGLSCFTVGGLERQMRRIAKSNQSFQWRDKREDGRARTASHIKISELKSQCEILDYGTLKGETTTVTH